MDSLNEAQKRHLSAECRYADKLLSDMEAVLTAAASKSPFPKYKPDLIPQQARVVQDYIARLRAQMVRVLEGFDIAYEGATIGSVHALRTILTFVDIAFSELRPSHMRGYGGVPEAAIPELNGLVNELEGIVGQLDAYLVAGTGGDLQGRLERLTQARAGVEALQTLERVISERGLVEFRSSLLYLIERLETSSFEIAVFGRVNSGKSSLLNCLLQGEVLPVGVNPITAVPTRIVYGPAPKLTVWFADRAAERYGVERLAEFAAEDHNPGNARHVTKIVVELPSPRLCEGIVLVDTPGLGSLATSGAEETRTYLPRCDLGVVLVDAGSTLTQEDVATIQALYQAGSPAHLLLSKADLLAPEDRERSSRYIADHIAAELGMKLPVRPVSVRPEQAALLEGWLREEILPLYSRHRELAAESLQRKIEALREAVQAALQTKAWRAGRQVGGDGAAVKKIENKLRRAAGRVADSRSRCEAVVEEVGNLGERALAEAAAQWVERPETELGGLVLSTVTHLAAEKAGAIRKEMEELARHLARALREASEALEMNDPEAEKELSAPAQELPRLDLQGLTVRARPPWVAAVSRRWAVRRVERKLYEQASAVVWQALNAYGRTLEAWTRRALDQVQKRFDAHAEQYRAQLAEAGNETSAEALDAIRRDLVSLAQEAARPRAEVTQ